MSFCRCSLFSFALTLVIAVSGAACRRDVPVGAGGGVGVEAISPARFPFQTNWSVQAVSGGLKLPVSEPFRLTNSFSIVQTELSPAVLVHSEKAHLTVFGGLTNVGLSAPKFVAWATRNGPRSFQRDEKLDVTVMAENWVLVWWAGAEGWTNWDCPWVVYLQHKPDTMSLDADGLHLDFPKRAGDVVMMPLYGYEKLPLEGRDFRAEHQLPKLKVPIKTWEWAKVIPRDPLTRVRYWGAATRDFPVRVEEFFRIDGARDELTIRTRFQRLSIADDWRSRRIKLTPVSPSLALAAKVGGFPIRFSERWFDLELPTPLGPCFGIQDVDEYEVTLPVLQYVSTGVENAAVIERLGAWLGNGGAIGVKTIIEQFEGSMRGGVVDWAVVPTALPLMAALGHSNELAALRVLVEKSAMAGSNLNSTVSLEGLWAYVNFAGETEIAKKFWPAVKSQFDKASEMSWAVPMREGSKGHTLDASRSLAFVRLAYITGDREAYRAGCVRLAGELMGLFIQERGAEYFYQHQPWHSMEALRKSGQWLSKVTREAGWQLAVGDGADSKWLGYPDADIARFMREVGVDGLGIPMERGLSGVNSGLSGIWRALHGREDFSTNGVRSGGGALPVVRLFPAGESDEFTLAASGQARWTGSSMVVSVVEGEGGAAPSWPRLSWPRWTTPTGSPWTFGEIRSERNGVARIGR